MSVEERTIEVEGKRLFYREWQEAEDAPTLLLIHGNTASGLWFERAMPLLAMNSVAPDLPNFGQSDPIETSDIETYAEYVRGFAEEVLGDSSFFLLGHSLGGAVAMSLALRMQSRILGMILLDSCAPNGLQTPEEYFPIIEQYATNRELLRPALAGVTPHMNDSDMLERFVDEAMRMNRESFVGNARALSRFDCSSRTKELDPPVLVLRGEEDMLITDEMAQATVAAFRDARLETIPGVGHSLVVEEPARFASLVRDFVESNKG